MAGVDKKELQGILFGAESELDLAALDGALEESDDPRATEMLSLRIDKSAMEQLRRLAESLNVGHTILARELLLAGLTRLCMIVEED